MRREVAGGIGQVLEDSERGQKLFGLEVSPRPGAHELSLRRQRALPCVGGRSLYLGDVSAISLRHAVVATLSPPQTWKVLSPIPVLRALASPSSGRTHTCAT